MASDGTMACQYVSGSGTNTLTFRGVRSQNVAGYLAFHDNFIHVNGTATLQSDSETFAGILAESGTTSVDSIVLDASSAAAGQVNGAVSDSTTITVRWCNWNNCCRASSNSKRCGFCSCCFNY